MSKGKDKEIIVKAAREKQLVKENPKIKKEPNSTPATHTHTHTCNHKYDINNSVLRSFEGFSPSTTTTIA